MRVSCAGRVMYQRDSGRRRGRLPRPPRRGAGRQRAPQGRSTVLHSRVLHAVQVLFLSPGRRASSSLRGNQVQRSEKKAEDTQDDAQGTQSSSSQDVNVYDVIARVSGTNERTNSDVITPPPPPPHLPLPPPAARQSPRAPTVGRDDRKPFINIHNIYI